MRTASVSISVLAVLFVLPLLASATHHEGESEAAAESASEAVEPKPWDQAAVADLAGRLGKHAEEMRQAIRKQSGTESVASAQNLAAMELTDTLRRLRSQLNSLRGRVQDGATREDTMSSFQRIDVMSRDAAEKLRRMFLTQANIDRVKQGSEMADELRRYYIGEPDTRPALVGPRRSDNPGQKPPESE